MRLFAGLIWVAASLLPLTAAGHPGPGIVVDSSGTTYAVRVGARGAVYKVDPSGKITTLIEGTSATMLRALHHLSINKKGRVYTAPDNTGIIWRCPGTNPCSSPYTK